MELNLAKLNETESFTYTYDDSWVKELVDDLNLRENFEIQKGFKINLKIERPSVDDDTFLIDETIKMPVKTQCSKCLESFIYNFEEKMNFTALNFTEDEKSLDIDNSSNIIDDDSLMKIKNHMLDVGQIVNEAISLSLPYALVCKEDCKGLCPKCGINKNKKSCKCTLDDNKEKPFAILKDLQK